MKPPMQGDNQEFYNWQGAARPGHAADSGFDPDIRRRWGKNKIRLTENRGKSGDHLKSPYWLILNCLQFLLWMCPGEEVQVSPDAQAGRGTARGGFLC
jgi:hypothetical protein